MSEQPKSSLAEPLQPNESSKLVEQALRRAALRARETARRYGTPIYVSRNGKVTALRP